MFQRGVLVRTDNKLYLKRKAENELPANRPPTQVHEEKNAQGVYINVYKDHRGDLYVYAEFWPAVPDEQDEDHPRRIYGGSGQLLQAIGTSLDTTITPLWKQELDALFTDKYKVTFPKPEQAKYLPFLVRAYVIRKIFMCDIEGAYNRLDLIVHDINTQIARNFATARRDPSTGDRPQPPLLTLPPRPQPTSADIDTEQYKRMLYDDIAAKVKYLNTKTTPPRMFNVPLAVEQCRLCMLPARGEASLISYCRYCADAYCIYCFRANRNGGRWFLACKRCYTVFADQDFVGITKP